VEKSALVIIGASSSVMQGYHPLHTYDKIFVGTRKPIKEKNQIITIENVEYFQYDLEKDEPAELELLNELEGYGFINLIFASYISSGLSVEDGIIEIKRGLAGNCIQPLAFMGHMCLRFPETRIGGVFISSIYAHISPKRWNYIDGPQINPIFYGVAKAGVEQGLRWLSCQNKKHYFNSIALGPLPKESVRQEYPEFIKRLVSSIPSNRLVEKKALHRTINYLLNQEGDVRGETIFVDGGYTTW